MSELEYYEKCLAEFQEALDLEFLEPEINNEMHIRLLKKNIDMCTKKIEELNNV